MNQCNYTASGCRYYTEQCKGCKFIYDVFGRLVCGRCDGHVALHQRVRTELGCIKCENYTRNLNSAFCERCIKEQKNE